MICLRKQIINKEAAPKGAASNVIYSFFLRNSWLFQIKCLSLPSKSEIWQNSLLTNSLIR